MQVEILGALTLVSGNTRLHLSGEKGRAALAMLALNAGKVVSFNALVDELWGDNPVHKPKNALQAHIKRMRKIIVSLDGTPAVDSLLRTVDSGYLLDIAPEDLDSNRFLELATRGARLVRDRPAEAVEVLGRALRLWRGPALVDVGEGMHCRAAVSWLDESRLVAEEDAAAAHLMLGGERQVVSQLEQLVARYPLRERFSEQLMVALYRCDRQAEAITVYHRLREHLAAELGLEPGLRLRDCYQAILAHDPRLVPSRA